MDGTADQSRRIALFCGVIIAALYVVGVVSGTELRHVVQTAPLWLCVVLGLKRVQSVRWLALPMLLFWLVLVVIIWMYLLGWTRIITGTFSPTEIAMTIVIGITAVVGIPTCVRGPRIHASQAVLLFVVGAAVQYAAFYISFLPSIARR